MNQKIKYWLIAFILLAFFFTSCNKKNKINNDIDPTKVNIVLTQPSLATATFVARCVNYDISVDTVFFLDPNSTVYIQELGGNTYLKNEEFMIGGYTPIDGIWVIQFRGTLVENLQKFDISIPYDMNIEEDDDEE